LPPANTVALSQEVGPGLALVDLVPGLRADVTYEESRTGGIGIEGEAEGVLKPQAKVS
jgi:hypothetical protein